MSKLLPLNLDILRTQLANGASFEYCFFWGGPRSELVQPQDIGWFSQWAKTPFIVDDVEYYTAEHYMMAQKAKLFDDDEAFNAIIREPRPDKVKALGRLVKGFDQATWNANCDEIVLKGSVYKFASREELTELLLSTGDAIIVEASPYDCIWGIGYGVNDPRCRDPHQWRGQNRLGFNLMLARQAFKEMI